MSIADVSEINVSNSTPVPGTGLEADEAMMIGTVPAMAWFIQIGRTLPTGGAGMRNLAVLCFLSALMLAIARLKRGRLSSGVTATLVVAMFAGCGGGGTAEPSGPVDRRPAAKPSVTPAPDDPEWHYEGAQGPDRRAG